MAGHNSTRGPGLALECWRQRKPFANLTRNKQDAISNSFMRTLLGNNCAKGCFIYLFALVLLVSVTSMGLGGLSAKFGGAQVQGYRPAPAVPSSGQEAAPPQSGTAAGGGGEQIPDGSGGGLPPTPVAAPPPTIAAPAPQPQPQPQPTSAPPPPSQGQGGTITGETSPPFYIVQPGDSVWLIAHKFGVDMDALRALNNIVDNLIYPGQIIYLPGSGGSPAPPSAPGAPSTGADPGTGSQPEAGGSDPTLPTMPNTGITTRKP